MGLEKGTLVARGRAEQMDPQLAPGAEFLRQVALSAASGGQVRKGEPSLAFWADLSLALASLHLSGLLGATVVSSCASVSLTVPWAQGWC